MKRVYHILSLLAMVNLFAVAGLLGYLFWSGKLSAERVDQIARVLRGEFPAEEVAATQPAAALAAPPEASRTEIARLQAQRQYYELLAERHKRETEDRLALNRDVQLKTVRLLEEIDLKQRQFKQRQKEVLQQSEQLGFEQALEMYSSIDPKKAKELLKKHEKEADVVRLLMEMDNSRRKKIINACKTEDELQWIGKILTGIRLMNEGPAPGVDVGVASSKGGG